MWPLTFHQVWPEVVCVHQYFDILIFLVFFVCFKVPALLKLDDSCRNLELQIDTFLSIKSIWATKLQKSSGELILTKETFSRQWYWIMHYSRIKRQNSNTFMKCNTLFLTLRFSLSVCLIFIKFSHRATQRPVTCYPDARFTHTATSLKILRGFLTD